MAWVVGRKWSAAAVVGTRTNDRRRGADAGFAQLAMVGGPLFFFFFGGQAAAGEGRVANQGRIGGLAVRML